MKFFVPSLLCFGVLILPQVGCQRRTGPQLIEMQGEVQFNEKPLPSGTITFIAIDNATQSAQAQIEEGHYKVLVPIGSKRVEINSSRWTGKPYKEHDIREMIQYLPKRYNQESELSANISSESETQLDFQLEDHPK